MLLKSFRFFVLRFHSAHPHCKIFYLLLVNKIPFILLTLTIQSGLQEMWSGLGLARLGLLPQGARTSGHQPASRRRRRHRGAYEWLRGVGNTAGDRSGPSHAATVVRQQLLRPWKVEISVKFSTQYNLSYYLTTVTKVVVAMFFCLIQNEDKVIT